MSDVMENSLESGLRSQLASRRTKLAQVMDEAGTQPHLVQLMQEIDRALEKMANGTYGLCEVCQGAIEPERLAADPLVRNCLDDLSREERQALERDLDLAYQVQRKLLPEQNLTFGPWKSAYHYEPVGPVSGDYCDIVIPDKTNGHLYFFVGDVAGKGVAASMLMAQLHAIFHSLVGLSTNVTQLMEQANRLFCEAALKSHFATLAGGVAYTDGRVELCNAGHCPPVHLGKSTIQTISRTGLPLGTLHQNSFTSKSVQLGPGEHLLLYTDGLTEATNRTGDQFGEKSLLGELPKVRKREPSAVTQHILDTVNSFRAGTMRTDDLTMLVLQRAE